MSKIAFVYPGQGAQKVGMGKDFYAENALARELYDSASKKLELDMKALCFEENDKLDQTSYTQAALVTTCLAITKVLEEKGLKPVVTAGLSLGEYAAIAAAGGMDYLDAISLVRTRGVLMEQGVPSGVGAMAAVLGLTGKAIEEVIVNIEGVSIANYNCPGQIVITGLLESVKVASEKLKEAEAKRIIFLNVSGPFHSTLLEEAGEKLGVVLENIVFHSLKVPYVTNVSATYVMDIAKTKNLLKAQVSQPVRWEQSVQEMIASGVDTFVEIGPGKTLTGFIKKINKEVKIYQVGTLEEVEKVVGELVC